MSIPIIGQPKIIGMGLVLQVECVCKTPFLLMGGKGATQMCPNPQCDRVFVIADCPPIAPTLGMGTKSVLEP